MGYAKYLEMGGKDQFINRFHVPDGVNNTSGLNTDIVGTSQLVLNVLVGDSIYYALECKVILLANEEFPEILLGTPVLRQLNCTMRFESNNESSCKFDCRRTKHSSKKTRVKYLSNHPITLPTYNRTEIETKKGVYKIKLMIPKLGHPVDLEIPPGVIDNCCLLYTSPSPRDRTRSRMPSSA